LARHLLDGAWRATRDLPEAFHGDAAGQLVLLGEARDVVASLNSEPARLGMETLLDVLRAMTEDWLEAQTNGADDFAQWCRSRQRDYPWAAPGHRRI
jgi:hypothetical protein